MLPNDEDENCWQQLIKDVDKLTCERPVPFTKNVKLKVVPKISPNVVYGGSKLKDIVIGSMDNIDASTAKKFKRGEFQIEAELDLHGYTENRAFEAVCDFIKTSYLQQKRCISIITGKGLHKNDEDDIFAGRGILKDRVPQWLNLPDIRPLILSVFHPEHIKGGSGAIHILLRRHRKKRLF